MYTVWSTSRVRSGHLGWTPGVDTRSGHQGWTPGVDTRGGHQGWTPGVDTSGGHQEWTPGVDTWSGHLEWTGVCGHQEWTPGVDTWGGHQGWTGVCGHQVCVCVWTAHLGAVPVVSTDVGQTVDVEGQSFGQRKHLNRKPAALTLTID